MKSYINEITITVEKKKKHIKKVLQYDTPILHV